MIFRTVYKSGQIFLPFCHNSRVWQTNGQTDGQTEFSSLDRLCIPCSAVKLTSTLTILIVKARRVLEVIILARCLANYITDIDLDLDLCQLLADWWASLLLLFLTSVASIRRREVNVFRLSGRPLTAIPRDEIFPYSADWFQWNLAQIFAMWVATAEKVFKVRGQRSRSQRDQTHFAAEA